jgi:two-component system response regulator BaeR
VVARVKAVLRRVSNDGSALSSSPGGLRLDPDRCHASFDGKEPELTAVEFQLLLILASQPGRIWSRDRLMERIYPDRRIVEDRTIDSHVKKLRRKLLDAGVEGEWIQSVYGVGYKLEPPEMR